MLRGVTLWTAAFVAVVLSGSSPVRAQSATALTWNAPPSCPSRYAVLADIERLLGRPLDAALPPDFHVDVAIEERGTTFHARAVLATGAEPRNVDGPTCAVVTEALTVMIAVAIDPNADLVSTTPTPPVAAPPPSTQPIVEPPSDSFVLHDQTVDAFEFRADAGFNISGSALPGAGAGLELGIGIRSRLFIAHASFGYSFARTEGQSAIASFDMIRGTFAGGVTFMPARAPFWIELLAVFEIARIQGTSRRLTLSDSTTGLWLGAGLDARARYELHSLFGLYFGISVIAALDRPHFDVTGLGTIFTSSAVDVRGEFGLTVKFGS